MRRTVQAMRWDEAARRLVKARLIPQFAAVRIRDTPRYRGTVYLRVSGDRLVRPEHVVQIDSVEPPSGVGPDEKWIDVNLARQTLTAYVGARPVFVTLVSVWSFREFARVTGLFQEAVFVVVVYAAIVAANLRKLIPVAEVVDVTHLPTVDRDLALIRVKAQPAERAELASLVDIFRARVVDVTPSSFTLEVTGDEEKLAAIIELLRPVGIQEQVRTGKVAIARGSKTARRRISAGTISRSWPRSTTRRDWRTPTFCTPPNRTGQAGPT